MEEAVVAEDNMKKLKLSVNGMHCASCAANLEKALKKISGVKQVSVSLMLKKAIVDVEDNFKTEELNKAISKVGYNLINVEEA